MPNTISATLVCDQLSKTVLQSAPSLVARFPNFASVGRLEKPVCDVQQVPTVTAVGPTLTDPTDWEDAGSVSTVTPTTVTPVHLAQTFYLSNADTQGGSTMATLAEANFRAFCTTVNATALAVLTAANFTATPAFSGDPANFALGDIGACRNAVKSPLRSLLCNTAVFNGVAPHMTNDGKLPGFRAVQEIDGLPTGVCGFVADPSAVVILTGLPDWTQRQPVLVQAREVQVPELGIAIGVTSWIDPRYRRAWFAYELVIGVSVGIAAGGNVLVSTV